MKTRGASRRIFWTEAAGGRPRGRGGDDAQGAAVIASARQRARRAIQRLSLTPAQAEKARRVLRDDRRQLAAARELLAECRRQLRQTLAAAPQESALVLELTTQERLLEARERQLQEKLEQSLAAILRPEQALRLYALPPAAVGDLLGRICG
jgi:7-keto-8-aminopelargonate synthetase-like enzyme